MRSENVTGGRGGGSLWTVGRFQKMSRWKCHTFLLVLILVLLSALSRLSVPGRHEATKIVIFLLSPQTNTCWCESGCNETDPCWPQARHDLNALSWIIWNTFLRRGWLNINSLKSKYCSLHLCLCVYVPKRRMLLSSEFSWINPQIHFHKLIWNHWEELWISLEELNQSELNQNVSQLSKMKLNPTEKSEPMLASNMEFSHWNYSVNSIINSGSLPLGWELMPQAKKLKILWIL